MIHAQHSLWLRDYLWCRVTHWRSQKSIMNTRNGCFHCLWFTVPFTCQGATMSSGKGWIRFCEFLLNHLFCCIFLSYLRSNIKKEHSLLLYTGNVKAKRGSHCELVSHQSMEANAAANGFIPSLDHLVRMYMNYSFIDV